MRSRAVGLLLGVAAVIHLVPLVGISGTARLSDLYGIDLADANILILMRHRAILFGLLGALLAFAAFRVRLRRVAIFAGLVSTVSFLAIAESVGQYNDALGRVVTWDIVAIGCLVGALVLRGRAGR